MTPFDPFDLGLVLALGAPPESGVSPWVQLVPIASLKVGDRVITSGGLFGSITRLGDKSLQLQVADKVRVEVSRAAIIGHQGQEPVIPEGQGR